MPSDDSALELNESPQPPTRCHGCGLDHAVDPDTPAPHETTFAVEDQHTDESGVGYRCETCSTLTRVPRDPPDMVSCRNCGEEIPEDLNGAHSCEWHPLGKAGDQRPNPMEEHR